MNYVSEGSAAIARSIERKFLVLPREAGIIFVQVIPQPEENGISTDFIICIGLTRVLNLDYNTGHALINSILKEEKQTMTIHSQVFIGLQGAWRDKDIENVDQAAPEMQA